MSELTADYYQPHTQYDHLLFTTDHYERLLPVTRYAHLRPNTYNVQLTSFY